MLRAMRPSPASVRPPLAALVALLAVAPLAGAAAPMGGPPCERLVAAMVRKVMTSGVTEIQLQVQAHRIAGMMVDAIGKQAGLPAAWKEGNRDWEEAYALLRPDLTASMKAAAERVARRQEKEIPPLLETEACAKQAALLETKAGALADRVESAVAFRDFLASFEKAFGVAPRLKKTVDGIRGGMKVDLALADRKDLDRTEPGLAAAREQGRAFGKLYIAALKQIGDGDTAVEQKAQREAGAAMMERHREALTVILRRAAGKGAGK
jgi:hypothetical protein